MQAKTLGELAKHVGGSVFGDPDLKIRSASTLERAGEGDISFLANRKYKKLLETTKASAVVVGKQLKASSALLIADDPYYAFTQIVILLHGHRKHKKAGISDRTSIDQTAILGKDCHIHDFVTISRNAKIGDRCILYPGVFVGPESEIGDDCILYPNVVIYERCKIGNRVIIQANATIGEDGFGFATHGNKHYKIPHIGRVLIGDDVEIGSGCGIERGTLDDTVIGEGTKICDLVVIGHGTKVGAHCLLVAQVGIAGSTTIGHHCLIGGQAGIIGHLNIGNNVRIAAQAAVVNDVPDGKTLVGAPAIEANQGKRAYSMIQYLPEIRQNIRYLKSKIAQLDPSAEPDSKGDSEE